MAKFPTMDEFAKDVADKVLDDYEYEGKTIREWVELILKDELTEVVRCKDCIHDNMSVCPLCYIENHTLQFINHDADFFCAYGERRENNV